MNRRAVIMQCLGNRISDRTTYATADYTGHDEFEGTREFMGQALFYSHTTPERLRTQLATAGLDLVDEQHRTIGGETFLWVTVARPA